jgi:hypothetical protein
MYHIYTQLKKTYTHHYPKTYHTWLSTVSKYFLREFIALFIINDCGKGSPCNDFLIKRTKILNLDG